MNFTQEELEALKRQIEGVEDSRMFLSMVGPPGEQLRPEGCMQIGAAVLLGKPILVIAREDEHVSLPLRRAAAVVLIGSPDDQDFKDRLMVAIDDLANEITVTEPDPDGDL